MPASARRRGRTTEPADQGLLAGERAGAQTRVAHLEDIDAAENSERPRSWLGD